MHLRPSLRKALILSFLAMSAIPLLAFGLLAQHVVSRSLEEQISMRNYQLAQSLSREVRQALGWPLLLMRQLRRDLESPGHIETDRERQEHLERLFRSNSQVFNLLLILDHNHRVRQVVPPDPDFLDIDWSRHLDYYLPDPDRPIWSFTFISPQTGQPAMSLTLPFAQGDLVAYVNLADLHLLTNRIPTREHGNILIVDRNGTAIAHSDRRNVYERRNLKDMSVVEQGLLGKEGTHRFQWHGRDFLGSVAQVPETGWVVAVTQDAAVAFQPVAHLRAALLLGVASLILLCLLTAVFILRALQRPLRQLADNARRVAMEDYAISPPDSRYREIRQLSAGFAAMIASVKNREEALRASEERYRILVESTPLPIVVHAQERIVFANRAAATVLGASSPQELISRLALDIMAQDHREDTRDKITELYEGRGGYDREERTLLRLTGSPFQAELSCMPTTFQGQPAAQVVFQDISARQQAAQERERLLTQLQQAQKMEAVGTLASGIAHDFNNILQAIGGYAQRLILDRDLGGHQRQGLERILESSSRGSQLIRRLLTLSRRTDPCLAPIDLNLTLRQAVEVLEHSLPKMIRIQMELAPDLWPVRGDTNQLQQVILNLGSNAADAMPDGGHFRISTTNLTLSDPEDLRWPGLPPGPYVQLTIADNGQGIPPEHLEHIFEPFYTTKEVGKGTGLGLSTVYGIVKDHGGDIVCQSQPERGAVFHLALPALPQAKPCPVTPRPAPSPVAGQGQTILLVDDELPILEVAQEMLREFGYRVLAAKSGEEALAVHQERMGEIDLVMMDLGMPGMGGQRALEELLRRQPGLKVLVASGYRGQAEAQARQAGAAGFVGKPYRFDDLLRLVRELLT